MFGDSGDEDRRNMALAAGALVGIGLVYVMVRRSQRCSEFHKIWTDKNPLHLTQEAQATVLDAARRRWSEVEMAGTAFDMGDVQLAVANELVECDWGKVDSAKGKQVWDGVRKIIQHAIAESNEG